MKNFHHPFVWATISSAHIGHAMALPGASYVGERRVVQARCGRPPVVVSGISQCNFFLREVACFGIRFGGLVAINFKFSPTKMGFQSSQLTEPYFSEVFKPPTRICFDHVFCFEKRLLHVFFYLVNRCLRSHNIRRWVNINTNTLVQV